jgi:flagellar L-ring protein precursor FlgH
VRRHADRLRDARPLHRQQPGCRGRHAAHGHIERVNTGSLFNNNTFTSPFNGRARPRNVGDSLKIEIAESMSATSKAKTDASRQNAMANKGPGSNSGTGFLGSILNLDAQASGSDSFSGDGSSSNSSNFTGQIAASVINVLPNGHLVVAGDAASP